MLYWIDGIKLSIFFNIRIKEKYIVDVLFNYIFCRCLFLQMNLFKDYIPLMSFSEVYLLPIKKINLLTNKAQNLTHSMSDPDGIKT